MSWLQQTGNITRATPSGWVQEKTFSPEGSATGSLSVSLADLVAAATASVSVSATLSQSLGDASVSASGAVAVSAALSQTLEEASASATASVAISADLSQTLGEASISASGIVTAAGVPTLSNATVVSVTSTTATPRVTLAFAA